MLAPLLATLVAWSPLLATDSPTADFEARHRETRAASELARSEGRLPWLTFREFAPRFLQLADDAPGRPEALASLLSVVELGSACIDTYGYDGGEPQAGRMARAMDRIVRDHLDDERVGRLCLVLSRLPSPTREEFLRRVVRDARSRSVQGRACLALAESLKGKLAYAESLDVPPPASAKVTRLDIWGADYLAQLQRLDRPALRAEAEQVFERVMVEFADVPYIRGTSETSVWAVMVTKDEALGRTLGAVAEANLEEVRHLTLGCVAPEIEGPDAEGKSFRLSDYRGQVVLLVFSGNWCGPCRGMYPRERELVARRRDQPFALLSVNTDEDVATLRESIRRGEITWRSWWSKGPDSSIPARWNVRSWPTSYVLDPQGVIRGKNLTEQALDDLVDRLLKEDSGTKVSTK